MIKTGQKISHYKIEKEIGRGGMGIVYKAYDEKLQRPVALKFLPNISICEPIERERFIHEARCASRLDHPNICIIYEADEDKQFGLFIAMAFYEGAALNKKIKQKPFPANEAIEIIKQVAEGLNKAHENKIVHRDIKPSNIFITLDGTAKILDFGLAKMADVKLTRSGTTLGTLLFTAPEMLCGEETDHRADIWSVGILLYHMLTGIYPFTGEYEQAIIYSILNEPPDSIKKFNNDIDYGLENIIFKCLQKNPKDRYCNISEFLDDISKFEKGKPIKFTETIAGENKDQNKQILIIEDDPAISRGLQASLEDEHYQITAESNGEKGYQLARTGNYDLIILDLMLPDKNGEDICRDLRKENINSFILMLTSKAEEIDRVLGLELGADDYMTKPFSIRELQARVRALFRREKK